MVIVVLLSVLVLARNISNNRFVTTFNAKNSADVEKSLNEVMKTYVKDENFSGTILVAKEGNIIFNDGYGYARRYFDKTKNTSETKFVLGSISKAFTAYAVLQLEEKNLLSLDDKVTKYFPKYDKWQNVTIRNLLNHSQVLKIITMPF